MRGRRTLELALVALLFAATTAAAAQETAEEALRRGNGLLQLGKAKRALSAFEAGLAAAEESSRRCSACLLGMAAAHAALDQHEKAEATARRVLAETGDAALHVRAHNFIGISYFARSIRSIPRPWSAEAVGLQRHETFRNNMRSAEDAFRAALELADDGLAETDREIMRWNLATALEWQGRLGEAQTLLFTGDCPEHTGNVERGDSPVFLMEDVENPRVISRVQPQYTSLARATRIEGVAIFQSIIAKDGTLSCIKALKGLPGLTAEAIKAIRQWRYHPATLDGEPVDVYFNLTVMFQLQ